MFFNCRLLCFNQFLVSAASAFQRCHRFCFCWCTRLCFNQFLVSAISALRRFDHFCFFVVVNFCVSTNFLFRWFLRLLGVIISAFVVVHFSVSASFLFHHLRGGQEEDSNFSNTSGRACKHSGESGEVGIQGFGPLLAARPLLGPGGAPTSPDSSAIAPGRRSY